MRRFMNTQQQQKHKIDDFNFLKHYLVLHDTLYEHTTKKTPQN